MSTNAVQDLRSLQVEDIHAVSRDGQTYSLAQNVVITDEPVPTQLKTLPVAVDRR